MDVLEAVGVDGGPDPVADRRRANSLSESARAGAQELDLNLYRTTGQARPPERWIQAFRGAVGRRAAEGSVRWGQRLLGARAASPSYVLGRKPA